MMAQKYRLFCWGWWKKWKLFCYAKSHEPQHQNKRSVRKRKARKHMLEKHSMAVAVEKLQLLYQVLLKSRDFKKLNRLSSNAWSKEAEELKKLQKRSFTKESINKRSADKHMWKDCLGTLAWISFWFQIRRVHNNSLFGGENVYGCQWPNPQFQKKWKGQILFYWKND